MKKIKQGILACAVALSAALLLGGCATKKNEPGTGESTPVSAPSLPAADLSAFDLSIPQEETGELAELSGATRITLSGSQAEVSGRGAQLKNGILTISRAGTYVLSGEGSNLQITVDAGKDDRVVLVLNGVTLRNDDRVAIYVRNAKETVLNRAAGTENLLADGQSYELLDGSTQLDATVFSKDDLVINGAGKLTVEGNAKHAVVSKDDLTVTGGTLVLTAKNVGLCGKDCVKVSSAALQITAGSDGVRSDNTEDPTRGYVYMENSVLLVTAGSDGIQAAAVARLVNCEYTAYVGNKQP